VDVVVTNPDGQSGTLAAGFAYNAPPAPTVGGANPNSGLTTGGTAVTITGTGFVSGASVSFGGTTASNITVVDATTITATTPAHAAGAVDIVVTNPDSQSGTLAAGFTYNAPPPPTVSSINPNTGLTTGGTAVTITGTEFQTGASVTFDGTAATNVIVVNSNDAGARGRGGRRGGGKRRRSERGAHGRLHLHRAN
jgi:hypothetical protein